MQCKLVVSLKKLVDINEYIHVSLLKIGARLLGKLTICIVAKLYYLKLKPYKESILYVTLNSL